MSTVSVLGSLYPVTTVVLAAMVLDERVAPRQAAGVAIVLGRHRPRQRARLGGAMSSSAGI
jgi:hypothetical protein